MQSSAQCIVDLVAQQSHMPLWPLCFGAARDNVVPGSGGLALDTRARIPAPSFLVLHIYFQFSPKALQKYCRGRKYDQQLETYIAHIQPSGKRNGGRESRIAHIANLGSLGLLGKPGPTRRARARAALHFIPKSSLLPRLPRAPRPGSSNPNRVLTDVCRYPHTSGKC